VYGKQEIMGTPSGIGFTPGQMSTLKLIMHAPNFIKLFTRLFTDRRVSTIAKGVVVLGVVYLLFPLDALSDLLVPLGWTDDLMVLAGALWLFIKLCPRRVVEEHVEIIDSGG